MSAKENGATVVCGPRGDIILTGKLSTYVGEWSMGYPARDRRAAMERQIKYDEELRLLSSDPGYALRFDAMMALVELGDA